MSNSDISIRLEHDSGQLSAQAFVDSIKHTLTILNCVEAEMAMRESGSIQWMIRELSYSSPAQATLGAEQDTDIAAQVASASFDGIDELSRGKSQPRHFSDAAIEATSDLSKISDDGGYRLRFIRQGQTVEVAGRDRRHEGGTLHSRGTGGRVTTGESGGKRYWDSTNWISVLAEDEAYRADICQKTR